MKMPEWEKISNAEYHYKINVCGKSFFHILGIVKKRKDSRYNWFLRECPLLPNCCRQGVCESRLDAFDKIKKHWNFKEVKDRFYWFKYGRKIK